MSTLNWSSSYWTSWTLDRLCHLVRLNGGTLQASRVSLLYAEDPCHWEVIQAKGGLKIFCETHHESLEWIDTGGPGHEKLLRLQESPARAAKKRLGQRVALFAGRISDDLTEAYASKTQLWEAWERFSADSLEPPTGFSRALFLLVQWRVLARAGHDWFRLVDRTIRNFKKRAPLDRTGALEGERPQLLSGEWASTVGLFPLPGEFMRLTSLDVYAMQDAVRKLLSETMGLTPKGITQSNSAKYQHAVLFAEELQMKYDISLYDVELQDPLEFARGLHTIPVPGLAEKRPSVLRGDDVIVECRTGKFRGFVHELMRDSIKVSLYAHFRNVPPFRVKFSFNRTPLRCMHRAVDEFRESLVTGGEITLPRRQRHSRLNEEQRDFLSTAAQLQGRGRVNPPPLLLWGPPGTGKTTTVVETIIAILRQQPDAKILATAPSNPAADLLCERLAEQRVNRSEMLRLVAVARDRRHVSAAAMNFARYDEAAHCFQVPKVGELKHYRVVVSTCITASYIRSSVKDPADLWFTHIFVDEAAQAMESETLVPLTLRRRGGQVFLAGDFKQLGPVIRSPVAISFGLGVPLMDRIVQAITVDHSRVFTLLKTYRAHPSILHLYNKTVYANVLQSFCPTSSYNMVDWPDCPHKNGTAHPIIFENCVGQETRSRESPSWQNLAEAELIKRYVMKLSAFGVAPADIGIVSPYHKQCQHLRYLCLGEGLDVEVGTTELFQGRERRVMLISTVRSREKDEVGNDFRFALGFLANYRRTNVALSRAKSMLIVVGNMALLSNDATWHNVIKLVQNMGCMRGPRFSLSRIAYGENSDWAPPRTHGTAAEQPFDGAVDRPWRDHL